ncbi:kinase-like protein, partial [Aureobasidium namibiae CBS 147.97]
INNYEIIDELGRGTHGKVKLGRNLATNEYVAIKIVERYSKKRRLGKLGNAEDKVKKEVAILKKARHPNIVALLEVIDDPARKKVYIVLERVELGEIVWQILDADFHPDLQFVPCMSMNAARVAFRDTVLGLQYLHYQGIIHRDIKPPNLLQTADHRTKISDFGVSYLGRPINDDQLAKTVGTAAFYAPELCYTDGTSETPPVGPAIDVWALGITLFCMLFGRTPFVDNEFVVMRRIADEEIYVPRRRLRPVDPRPKSRPSSHGRYFPPAASGKRSEYELAYEDLDDLLLDLFRRLLQKDPAKRITLEEVRHHPWVVQD